jgi:hypothetical protein
VPVSNYLCLCLCEFVRLYEMENGLRAMKTLCERGVSWVNLVNRLWMFPLAGDNRSTYVNTYFVMESGIHTTTIA